jgi:hypothetical protein
VCLPFSTAHGFADINLLIRAGCYREDRAAKAEKQDDKVAVRFSRRPARDRITRRLHAALKRRDQMFLQSADRCSISLAKPAAVGFSYQWRNRMTKLKLLSAALITAATLATPAMARESHVRHRANATATTGEGYVDGRLCKLAPAVGAFATQPWDNGPPCEPASVN